MLVFKRTILISISWVSNKMNVVASRHTVINDSAGKNAGHIILRGKN